ncbi:TetR/AcrR family transcriptional regulator [Tistrella mobilis]|uniref:TetR/AcrR family transcriptional regulator n=1 Tax=Tistrella mobilis TaxID=171437 RepID=UPI0031F6723C
MARPRKDQAIDIPGRAVVETIRLLEERDPMALTMAEVAAAIGCSAPALYNHFRNRDALLRAVHDEGFRRLYDTKLAVAARTAGDAVARLREGGLAYLAFAAEHPALYRLMFAPPPLPDLAGDPFAADPGMTSLTLLRGAVEAVQAEGLLPGRDPGLVAFTLWSAVHGAASLIAAGRAPARGETAAALCRGVVDTIMGLILGNGHPDG